MPLLTATGLSKAFAGEPVFTGVSLSLEPGGKYGLVGPNGSGKSTLARILVGQEESDAGGVTKQKGLRLVYLPQRPSLRPGHTVRQEVLAAFDDLVEMEERLRGLEEKMGRTDLPPDELKAVVARHERLLTEFELRGGWQRERLAEAALDGLKVPVEARDRDVATLSGGQATRVALARALLRSPDLLILDEPTNHLDLDATEWLENEILARPAAFLLISHDRWFLDRAARRMFELEAGRLHAYPGNYSAFERLRAERREREAAEYEKQRAYIEKEEDFIRRNIAAQNVSMARGKRKRLARIERKSGPVGERGSMTIPDTGPDAQASDVLVLEGVTARVGDLDLLGDGLSLRIPRGQCVGVVGPNGAGKTTLLRLVTGELDPAKGRVERGRKVRVGYLPQEPVGLTPGRTVLETVHARMPSATYGEVRSYVARFLFTKGEVEKDVAVLSGGEAGRLALSLLFLDQPNFLVLDEPTNHLDIAGREALEGAIARFPGTVLLVSHDRYLLEGVADRIIEIRLDEVIRTDGGWSDHLRKKRERAKEQSAAARKKPKTRPREKPGKKKLNVHKLARIEARIMEIEERMEEIRLEMTREEVYRDADRIRALQNELPRLEEELAAQNVEWEEMLD